MSGLRTWALRDDRQLRPKSYLVCETRKGAVSYPRLGCNSLALSALESEIHRPPESSAYSTRPDALRQLRVCNPVAAGVDAVPGLRGRLGFSCANRVEECPALQVVFPGRAVSGRAWLDPAAGRRGGDRTTHALRRDRGRCIPDGHDPGPGLGHHRRRDRACYAPCRVLVPVPESAGLKPGWRAQTPRPSQNATIVLLSKVFSPRWCVPSSPGKASRALTR